MPKYGKMVCPRCGYDKFIVHVVRLEPQEVPAFSFGLARREYYLECANCKLKFPDPICQKLGLDEEITLELQKKKL